MKAQKIAQIFIQCATIFFRKNPVFDSFTSLQWKISAFCGFANDKTSNNWQERQKSENFYERVENFESYFYEFRTYVWQISDTVNYF